VLPWITAIALGLVFILWFFTWVGAYPGGYGVYTQSAFQILGGGHSTDPVGEKVLHANDELEAQIGGDWLLLLYFLAAILAMAFAVAVLVFSRDRSRLLPSLQPIWPWRLAIVAVAAALAFLILLLQLWRGFGLETGVARLVDAKLERKRSAATTPEEKAKVEIERGSEIGRYVLERTTWYRLAVLCHLVAIGAVGLEMWMNRRRDRPLPQLQIQW
jgi:hypothetical protein